MTDWNQIEHRLGVTGLEAFAQREITPMLADLPLEDTKKNGRYANRLELPMTVGFFGFGAAFFVLNFFFPETFLGVLARFILFPVLFFGFLIGAFYLFRDRLAEALTHGKARYIGQAKALTALAEKLDLTYVPSPGGAPDALKFIARQRWAPAIIADAVSIIDDHELVTRAMSADHSSQDDISAIVVSYYTGAILEKCLKALDDDEAVTEIILVDNGNPDGDIERATARLHGDVEGLCLGGGLYFASSRQRPSRGPDHRRTHGNAGY